MITRVKIDNFKSLVDFELPPKAHELGGFTCLIGLNGAGKSTLLQAFDFVAQLASGSVEDWLNRREWKKIELLSHWGTRKPVISFTLGIRTAEGVNLEWCARFNTTQMRCTYETITDGARTLLKLEDGQLTVSSQAGDPERFPKIPFEFEGSILSNLKLVGIHPNVAAVKSDLQSLRSLELLSPHAIRRRAKTADDIGTGGEKLSAFLSTFTPEQREGLLRELQQFYPDLQTLQTGNLTYGWKALRVRERYADVDVDAKHLNDGLLRVLAFLAQTRSAHRFLLFDEIENGINPALVGKLMDFLVGLGAKGKQVVVTTHSPVILNFLDDDVARKGVILLYKTRDGRTRSALYFEQPETGHKLRALGPGEVFVDTDLTKLVERLRSEEALAASDSGSGK